MAVHETNCPINELIGTLAGCATAARRLQFEYFGDVQYSNRPAGCYTYVYSIGTKYVYFNKNIDPSSAAPADGTAGVCKNSGGFHLRLNRLGQNRHISSII